MNSKTLMESLDQAVCFMDDLLDFDFDSDIGEEDDDVENHTDHSGSAAAFLSLRSNASSSSSYSSSSSPPFDVFNNALRVDSARPLPDFVEEEELEWLSNKDAFPSVETFTDILSQELVSFSKHRGPVSVLESCSESSTSSNTGHSGTNDGVSINHCWSFHVPVKMRSKLQRRRRRDFGSQKCCWSQENLKKMKVVRKTSAIGRKCQHCGAEKTPQWRAGPSGPKTLCNACGVRFKSGRLVPEYRPANSPTFCSIWHSNSHRKVLEMRRQKQIMGVMVVKPMEKVQ